MGREKLFMISNSEMTAVTSEEKADKRSRSGQERQSFVLKKGQKEKGLGTQGSKNERGRK